MSGGILSQGIFAFLIFGTHKVWGNLSWGILSQVKFSLRDLIAGRLCQGGFCHRGF